MDTPDTAGAAASVFQIGASGAPAVPAAGGSVAAPATVGASHFKLVEDVEGIGRYGQVIRASTARAAPLIAAGQAVPATDFEVAVSAPQHIILED